MKSSVALSLLALLGQAAAVPSALETRADAWKVYFWTSISCTSAGTGTITGSDTKCHKIPDYGVTASFDYYAKNSKYRLHLYQNDDCSGTEESYEGLPNQPECTTTGTYKSFKVNQHVTKRDELELATSELGHLAVLSHEERSLLEARREFSVNMAFGAAIASATFAYMAAGTCPASANEGDVNKTQCGIGAVTAVFAGFFAAYQVGGLLYHNGPTTSKRDLMLPQDDEELMPGYRLSMNYMDAVTDDAGTAWHHYAIHTHDIEANHTHKSTLVVHPTENRQHVFAAADGDSHNLEKRAGIATAYYAWKNEDKYYYQNTGHGTTNTHKVALQTWNHGHSQGISSFCADVVTVASAHKWNQGYFALITGTFTDYSNQC